MGYVYAQIAQEANSVLTCRVGKREEKDSVSFGFRVDTRSTA